MAETKENRDLATAPAMMKVARHLAYLHHDLVPACGPDPAGSSPLSVQKPISTLRENLLSGRRPATGDETVGLGAQLFRWHRNPVGRVACKARAVSANGQATSRSAWIGRFFLHPEGSNAKACRANEERACHQQRRPGAACAGVTLLEIMIVVVIIGILGAFAIPGVLQTMPLRRLKADAADIANNMKYAKMNAVKRNQRVGLYFDGAEDAYVVYVDSGSDSNDFDAEDEVLKPNIALRMGVAFDTASASWSLGGDSTVVFSPNGSATKSGTVVITESSGNDERSIVVNPPGRIRIQ